MTVTKMPPRQDNVKKPAKTKTKFTEFAPYENGRVRYFKFDVNALADFEQETGMGFSMLLKQRAVFASARAMIWAGLKHEDRGLSIEDVGILISDYLKDESVEQGTHTIDTVLTVAIAAAVEQGALGRIKEKPAEPDDDDDKALTETSGPNAPAVPAAVPVGAVEGQIVEDRTDLAPLTQTPERDHTD